MQQAPLPTEKSPELLHPAYDQDQLQEAMDPQTTLHRHQRLEENSRSIYRACLLYTSPSPRD